MRRILTVAALTALAAGTSPLPTATAQQSDRANSQAVQAAQDDQGATQAGQAGQSGQAGQQSGQRGGQAIDRLFAAAAAASDLAEITSSQMALQQAGSEEVRRFAQQMVQDHTKSSQQLQGMARSRQMSLPREMDVKDQAAIGQLSALRGAEFDREYAKLQLVSHLCAVSLFKNEAQRGQDPDLKGMASQLLPRLQEHLNMARQLPGATEAMQGSGGSGSRGGSGSGTGSGSGDAGASGSGSGSGAASGSGAGGSGGSGSNAGAGQSSSPRDR